MGIIDINLLEKERVFFDKIIITYLRENIMEKKDWLLVYIYLPLPPKNLIDPIRIMKGLFLISKKLEGKLEKFYEFKPYLYGPCSFEVYRDLLSLNMSGLIDEYTPLNSSWSYYRITKEGEKQAKKLVNEIPKDILKVMKKIKQEVVNLSFLDLLRKVYKEYPDYAKNSIVSFGEKNDSHSCVGM